MLLIYSSTRINAQILPNGDMESWSTYTAGIRTYEEPSSGWWASLNPMAKLTMVAPITVTKVSGADVHTGSSAARLETMLFTTMKLPGVLCAGAFVNTGGLSIPTIHYGQSFTQTPTKLRLYYKYSGINNDSMGVYIQLSKYNSLSNKRDTIAKAGITRGNANAYTLIDMDLEYFMYAIPDTIILNISSSFAATGLSGGEVGSVVYIDDITLVDNNGIESSLMPEISINIYPNPSSNVINIVSNKYYDNSILQIFNSNGAKVYETNMSDTSISIDISDFSKGLYYLRWVL